MRLSVPLVVLPWWLAAGCFGLQDNMPELDSAADTGGGGTSPEEESSPAVEADLTGALYVIAPDDLTVTEPAGVDALLHESLNQNVLMYVADASSSSLSLDLSLAGADGRQDPCERVRELPVAEWDNPVFYAGPGEMDVSFGGQPAVLRHLTLSGTFDADAQAWHSGTMTTQLDSRELSAALGGADACELLAAMGTECGPCDDGTDACFTLVFDDVQAARSSSSYDTTPTCR